MNNIYTGLPKPHHWQQGLTLVEILVALMISAFLLGGVIQLFIGSKQTYRAQDAVSRIQENGRFALETMARDIRMTGYYPRVTTKTITGTGTQQIITSEQTPEPTWSLKNNGPIFGEGSDNNRSIAVQWRNENNLAFITRRYSIGSRSGTQAPTCPGAANSLFLEQDGNTAQELIEGVQLMRVFYGEDTNPGINPNGQPSVPRVYVPAAGVTNWGNVVSVQIHLLLVSLENNLTTTGSQTVMFPNDMNTNLVQQAVSDRCLGQAFSTTIAIRNFPPIDI